MAALPVGYFRAGWRSLIFGASKADPGWTESAMAVVTANKPGAGTPDRKHNIEAMRQDYYARISQQDMAPLGRS